ncbi:MAG: hypothetical protein KDB79_13000, partial [Acidobacteria bacterium]|nr:hypothetical protein [Acidobacteriota bacterium]
MNNMQLFVLADQTQTRNDLVTFVEALRSSLETQREDWENPTLDQYLEALGAVLESLEYGFQNRGEEFPKDVDWRL